MPIGIMSAMHEEIHLLLEQMQVNCETTIGMRTYYEGLLWENEVVLVFSRWGKVAASSTTTTLIERFEIDELIFSGVAGAINSELNIGDVVIGNRLVQHDMNASPLFEKYEIPLTEKKYFETNNRITNLLHKSAQTFFVNYKLDDKVKKTFNLHSPKLYLGTIASGDEFVSDIKKIYEIRNDLSDVLCVEMEGAAVAQVCYEYDIPFGIVRTISDSADESAHIDFVKFVEQVASHYTVEILENYFRISKIIDTNN